MRGYTEEEVKMKITALPFIAGSAGYAYFLSGDYSFTIGAGIILTILMITKQVKLI